MHEGLVIDTRSPEAFASAHIASSYNIWLDGVPAFGGWVANENTCIFLVVDHPEGMQRAVMSLARIGLDSVGGLLLGGVASWREQGLPIEMLATTSARQTANWMQQDRIHILDVRDEYEWDEKHIPGALHQVVGHLEENLPRVPKDGELVVHCSVGHRAGLAVSILKRHGYTNVYNMLGGLTAWEQLDLPLVKPDTWKKER